MVEFVIAAPVLLLLGLGTVQTGLLYHANTVLDYATFEAARKGAVNHAEPAIMQQEFGIRLAPVYGGDGSEASMLAAIQTSVTDNQSSPLTTLTVLNPTAEAFEDWGLTNALSGHLEIPNSHLRQRDDARVPGPASGVTLQDANILKLKATYGFELKVPLVNRLFLETMTLLYPENAAYYASNRVPLQSVATLRMQSPARRAANVAAAAAAPAKSGDELSLVAAHVPATLPPCDDSGLAENLDANALEQLMMIDSGSSAQCAIADTSVGALLSLPISSSPQFNGEKNATTVTDCTPK